MQVFADPEIEQIYQEVLLKPSQSRYLQGLRAWVLGKRREDYPLDAGENVVAWFAGFDEAKHDRRYFQLRAIVATLR
jgi:hypothetical protein